MNRMSRLHRKLPNYRHRHHGLISITVKIIIVIVIFFAGCFYFSNRESPVNHQPSKVQINQRRPVQKTTPKRNRQVSRPQIKKPQISNLTKLQAILNHSHLPIQQRQELIKFYKKLSNNQQGHILKIINHSRNGLKLSQTKLKNLENYLTKFRSN